MSPEVNVSPQIGMDRSSVVVMISGVGSLLEAILETAREKGYPARIIGVVSDRPCPGLKYAEAEGVPTDIVSMDDYATRQDWDQAIADVVGSFQPEWVVAAGFMKIFGPAFLTRFDRRIINSHPALLPSFPGAHAVDDALAYGVKVTGTTIHLIDSGIDTGPILAQEAVRIHPNDDAHSLQERIKSVERRLLPQVLSDVVSRGVITDGRKASIKGE